jgi:guanosine-3',5'-bis(diphosphate) 3'-pyrophosphohydrolase
MEKEVKKAYEHLVEQIRIGLPHVDLKKVEKAFKLSYKLHKGQMRASGEPYILHPIAVAEILLDIKLDTDSIVTAILHDTVEDTSVTLEDIAKEFGDDVARLVDGVTKLAKIEYQPEHVKQAENFRKLLLAISEDIRVLLVKLADRVHNMRTLNHIGKKDKRVRIAHETMEIYAPLAERIGIHKFKNELQDLAFAELHPDIRQSILSRLSFLRKEGTSLVDTIKGEVSKTLEAEGIKADIQGREKTSCSIWRKMESKNVAFEQLADIMAFRVIVDDISECYKALGIIHFNYHMIPGGFKDYISTPKGNGYRSLHTVVMGPEKRCIEIQIRTQEMHEIAELGVAAHWAYKQSTEYKKEGVQYRWIRELLDILENTSSPQEFLENTKLEMYYDQVFCFTPKGDLIALPRGATPVDFAFAVHSNVGLTCIGARVNGRIVPLKSKLDNGDQVEILRSKTPMPSPSWEKFVVTGKARAEIRKFIRSKQVEEYYNLGKVMLSKAFQQEALDYQEKELEACLDKFKKKNTSELVAAVGEGIIHRNEVLKAVHPELVRKKAGPLSFFNFKSRSKQTKAAQPKQALPIRGLIPGMAVHFAGCCHPLPGDRIVGIVNTGRGITIHTVDCDMLENFSSTPERWIDVAWEDTENDLYIGRIKITTSNEPGSLASITAAIADANISNIKIVGRSLDFFELILDVDVKGIDQLNNVITALRSLSCIHSVERAKF